MAGREAPSGAGRLCDSSAAAGDGDDCSPAPVADDLCWFSAAAGGNTGFLSSAPPLSLDTSRVCWAAFLSGYT